MPVPINPRSAFLRRQFFDRCGEDRMLGPIDGLMRNPTRRRSRSQIVVVLPIGLRPNRALAESTPAIGADIKQHLTDTTPAKRAFEGADHRFERIGRQRLVAVFARRPEFKRHGIIRELSDERGKPLDNANRHTARAKRSKQFRRVPSLSTQACRPQSKAHDFRSALAVGMAAACARFVPRISPFV